MNVLVIDDDLVNCEILGETIAAVGFTVHCVNDGQAAIDAMKAQEFPLVVCDWEMPGIDGPQFCRWLRASDRAKSTYVIMLTARQGVEHTVDGISSGADTFLSKPCDAVIVIDHLRLGARLLGPALSRPAAA
jgi:two-component system chemotaxis response regulator CheY